MDLQAGEDLARPAGRVFRSITLHSSRANGFNYNEEAPGRSQRETFGHGSCRETPMK